MIIFDLKTLVFILFCVLFAVIALTVWLSRRALSFSSIGMGDGPLLDALDAAPFGLLILESETLYYANVYAQRLLHLPEPQDDLPDSDWLPLLSEDRVAVKQDVQHAQGTGRYRSVTFASGQTARWWVTTWRTRDFVFLLDITAQQRAEQAGRALINDLAHELRTPVATILTHLEILGLDDVGEEVWQQSLVLSREETQRMARLLNDMLELGRLETAPPLPKRPLDLMALVEDVVLQSSPRAAECEMALSVEAASPLPLVMGDADRLRQVFLNLLDNAFKYARAGDQVILRIYHAQEGVVCEVCDTGPGIPPEHLPYVIRRFYRAAPQCIEGSGLGLSLVAEILRRHDSALRLESPVESGHGLCACFVLPIREM